VDVTPEIFLPPVLCFLLGYALGAIPFGLLLTRAAGLGDVRKIGSGNIGATNVLRTGNKGLAVATLLLAVPGLDFGWWTAIGGEGNPAVGVGREGAAGPLETVLPVIFMSLLLIGLPLLVEGEEWVFRRGAEHRSRAANARRSVLFGLVHALVGVPIGVAIALSVGGVYFTWTYLRMWTATRSEEAALAESTRSHLAYNLVIAAIIIVALATSSV